MLYTSYKTSGNNKGDLEWLATQIQQCRKIHTQALCDIFYTPVADMLQNYCVGEHFHKYELIAGIQAVASRL